MFGKIKDQIKDLDIVARKVFPSEFKREEDYTIALNIQPGHRVGVFHDPSIVPFLKKYLNNQDNAEFVKKEKRLELIGDARRFDRALYFAETRPTDESLSIAYNSLLTNGLLAIYAREADMVTVSDLESLFPLSDVWTFRTDLGVCLVVKKVEFTAPAVDPRDLRA